MDNTQDTARRSFNPMIVVAVVAVLIVAGIGFMMFQGQSSNNTPQTQTTQTTEGTTDTTQISPATETSTESGETDSSVKTFNIEAGSFYFNPNEIRVKQGDTVKIVMTSKDMMHDFVIDELGIKMPVVQSGNTGEVEFTADQKGTFEFYCSVGQHRSMGQVGTLIVE